MFWGALQGRGDREFVFGRGGSAGAALARKVIRGCLLFAVILF